MANVIDLTKKLVSFNSVSGNEYAIQQFIFDFLKGHGFEPKMQYVFDNRPNVICTSGEGKRHLLLDSHIDTVSVCSGWAADPFTPREHGDKIIGLGAADQKAGVALHLEQFVEGKFDGQMTIATVVDEEVFSTGSHHLLSNNRLSPNYAIFSEPSFANKLEVVNAVPGRFAFDISVIGKSAHGATMEGVNAIVEAAKLITEIQKIKPKPHPVMGAGGLNIGSIKSGSEFLSVPEHCEFRLDRHTVAGETMDLVLSEIRTAISNAHLKAKVEIKPIARPSPFIPAGLTPVDSALVQKARAAFEANNFTFSTGMLDSTFDMGYTVQAGIPSVSIGPIGSNLHAAEEYVLKSSIEDCRKIYRSLLKEL
ncbi:MAG: M20/M25/M40 family metallo-hydrolase [Candidatus Micrarchaeia archaeon]